MINGTMGVVIELPAGKLLLASQRGIRIECFAGDLWITRDHDCRDVVLAPGESFEIVLRGRIIIQALTPARVRLEPAAPGYHSADGTSWLRSALRARIRFPRLVGR